MPHSFHCVASDQEDGVQTLSGVAEQMELPEGFTDGMDFYGRPDLSILSEHAHLLAIAYVPDCFDPVEVKAQRLSVSLRPVNDSPAHLCQ